MDERELRITPRLETLRDACDRAIDTLRDSQLDATAYYTHQMNRINGFYEGNSAERTVENRIVKLALIITEVCETIEAIRKGNSQSEIDEELADIFIRFMDYCGWNNAAFVSSTIQKLRKNATRPYKHGKVV